MTGHVSRRQALKWVAGASVYVALGAGRETRPSGPSPTVGQVPNLLLLVFDALSATNMSLYGYPRHNTSEIEGFAERATVYHRHYAAGNFTNPGTKSLLTGTYPWTHRVLHLNSSGGLLSPQHSLFALLGQLGYHNVAHSQNLNATVLLEDWRRDIHHLIATRSLALRDAQWSDRLFPEDYAMAVWRERLFRGAGYIHGAPTSFFARLVSRFLWSLGLEELEHGHTDSFPVGMPTVYDQVLRLEEAIDWLIDNLAALPQPFAVYFHLLPPHGPYRPRSEFVDLFGSSPAGAVKPVHHFHEGWEDADLAAMRQRYDEYIAYADAEFGRLLRSLSDGAVVDRTIVALTADHGEMFERGICGHVTPVLYEPIVRIPLVVASPGQQKREDVHGVTSCVDVVPTLLRALGAAVPDWCEGEPLPPSSEARLPDDRSVFSVEAKQNPRRGPLRTATLAMIQGRHKLIHYCGYSGLADGFELYDVEADPEELDDIYPSSGALGRRLRDELLARLDEVNRAA